MKEEDFKDYFLKYNREAYIDYITNQPLYGLPEYPVFFGPWIGFPTPHRRPIIDEEGHRFWVTSNFTGTCEEFPWNYVPNKAFAQAVKREQGQQPYFGRSVISCSCECRVEGQKY
jgi:hypothetical protein